MTLDPRGPMRSGQPLALSAAQLNWINQQMRGPGMGGGALSGYGPAPWSRIKVLWSAQNSDRVLKPWSFDALNGNVVNYPSSDDDYWNGVPLLQAINGLSSRYDRRGIFVPLEPIKSGSIGWAAVSGVVPVRIDVKNTNDTHAMPFVPHYTSAGAAVQNPYTNDNAGEWRLQTFPFAGYKVVWDFANTPTDNVWALIDLSSYWAQPLVLGLMIDNEFDASSDNIAFGGNCLVRLCYLPKPEAAASSQANNPLNYYVTANNTFGLIENQTFVWMTNPYAVHSPLASNFRAQWEIVAVEHEPWSVNSQGYPVNSGRVGQTVMLPKP